MAIFKMKIELEVHGTSDEMEVGHEGLAYYKSNSKADSLLYLAKVLKKDKFQSKWKYYIHYQGWKKSQDEWVDNLLPITPGTLELQKQLIEEAQKRSSELKRKRATDKLNGKKNASTVEVEETITPLTLRFNPAIQSSIIEDFENISKHKMLPWLPRDPSIDHMLTDYLDFVSNSKKRTCKVPIKTVSQILWGIRIMFNRSLGSHLLYDFERLQHNAMAEANPDNEEDWFFVPNDVHGPIEESNSKKMYEIYGSEHLLRLFIRLPELLSSRHILLEYETATLAEVIHEVLDFVAKHQKMYLHNACVLPSHHYLQVFQDYI